MFRQVSVLGTAAVLVTALVAMASVAQAQPSACNGRSLSNGGSITPSDTPATVQGSVTPSQGVYYPVVASAAASYTFTMCSNGGGSNYDPWLCLYNSAGTLLQQVDDSCGLQPQIIAQLAAGNYYIAVSGFSSSSGNYTLAYVAPGVIPNVAPNAPTGLIQAANPGGTAANPGFVSDATIYFRANVTDNDAGDLVGVEVEILPANVAFDPTNVTGQTGQTAPGSFVPSGQVAETLFTFNGNPFGSGDYHWRLRGIDEDGGEGPWVLFNAAAIHFTVDMDPPSVPPGPFRPGEGDSAGVIPPAGDVTFQWGAASDIGPPGPISYHIQISAAPGFTVNLVDEIVTTNEHTTVLEIAPTPYFWRVAAIDNAGNQGPFTLPMSFIVKFNDSINHGGGDCNISAGVVAGPLIPAAMAALLLAFGLSRRRRA
jgi:hypothetical protein